MSIKGCAGPTTSSYKKRINTNSLLDPNTSNIKPWPIVIFLLQVKCNGRFTGDNVSYIYPDFETVLRGKFVDDVMVEAAEAKVSGCFTENGILGLEISEPKGPTFRFWPSTRTEVLCPHLQQDPFEKKVLVAAKSSTQG